MGQLGEVDMTNAERPGDKGFECDTGTIHKWSLKIPQGFLQLSRANPEQPVRKASFMRWHTLMSELSTVPS